MECGRSFLGGIWFGLRPSTSSFSFGAGLIPSTRTAPVSSVSADLNKPAGKNRRGGEMMMGGGGPETLTLFELQYSDLLKLSSESVVDSSLNLQLEERNRLDSISRTIMEALGPTGPGLLSVAGVPDAPALRRMLLRQARKLSLLANEDRKRILKEHGLGSDVPLKNLARTVSSFARNLQYKREPDKKQNGHEEDCLGEGLDVDFTDLGYTFERLGRIMIDIGIRLARVCDRAVGGRELEQSLIESCAAKGRLIHYHSALDNLILREQDARQRKKSNKSSLNREKDREMPVRTELPRVVAFKKRPDQAEVGLEPDQSLWQKWHYDYGILTILTDPLFLYSTATAQTSEEEIPSPTGHTCLQVLDAHKSKLVSVKSSPENFIVQVGESADVLSKSKLRATLHSVSRPSNLVNLSRETFVVFLQPAWIKVFTLEDYPTQQWRESSHSHSHSKELDDHAIAERTQCQLVEEIQKTIPPLCSRLKEGMTFADFSKQTTRQYYGVSGLQSNRLTQTP